MNMYHVYYTNIGYFADESFAKFDDAVAYAKSKGFDATIILPYTKGKPYKGGEVCGTWGILSGLRDYRTPYRVASEEAA